MTDIQDVNVKTASKVVDLTPKNPYDTMTTSSDYDPSLYFSPERHKNEKFEEYKIRRSAINQRKKNFMFGGIQVWDSTKQGTYIKAKHGLIGHKAKA